MGVCEELWGCGERGFSSAAATRDSSWRILAALMGGVLLHWGLGGGKGGEGGERAHMWYDCVGVGLVVDEEMSTIQLRCQYVACLWPCASDLELYRLEAYIQG